MSELLLVPLFLLVGAGATAVVLTPHPGRQAVTLSAYGLVLGLLMLALQAPDVAMSELAVGGAVLPLLVVLAVAACDRATRARDDEEADR